MADKIKDEDLFEAPGFPDIGEPDEQEQPETEGSDKSAAVDAQYAAMDARIKAAEERNASLEAMTLAALSSRNQPVPTAETQPQTPSAPQIDFNGLPDPLEKPAEYHAELAKRVQAAIASGVNSGVDFYTKQQQRASSQEVDMSTKTEQLWNAFVDAAPEYASNEKRMEFIASQVVSKARATGIDPNVYMFQTRDKFFRDVKAEYDSVFGSPTAADEDSEDKTQQRRAADSTANRTGGIAGGSSGGGSRSSGGQQQPKKTTFTDELIAMQNKIGI